MFRRTALCAAACATLAVGCGTTDSDTATVPTTRAPGVCEASANPATPTIDQLNALLARGLDPAVPAAEKTDLVQGSEADPYLFDRIQEPLRQVQLAVRIDKVTDDCAGHVTTDAVLTINGQDNPGQIPLVAEDGTWKLETQWACGFARTLDVASPLCD